MRTELAVRKHMLSILTWLCLVCAFGFRLVHITGPIDEFSAWRQAETAYMTLRLAGENPPEFLHSKVPYRGGKDVHLAELPIQPLIMAYGYKLLGRESLVFARTITMLFFWGGVYFIYLIVCRLLSRELAMLSVAIYAWLPLGLGYSRAVHVDFCILFFCYAYLYCGIRFFHNRQWRYWILSMLAATFAFAMKAPYCFFLGLPMLIHVFGRPSQRTVQNFVLVCALFVLPFVVAFFYNMHRIALEAGEVESLVYCMKWTPELSRELFLGTFAQRLDLSRWQIVVKRIWFWVLTPPGAVLALLGLLYFPRDKKFRCRLFAVYGWYIGAVIYALLVFPIFSSPHDYYSLPLLAPAAIAVSLGIYAVRGYLHLPIMRFPAVVVLISLVVLFSVKTVQQSRRFETDGQRLLAGKIIKSETDPGDLVLSVTLGRSTGWSDPRILYYANRRGWAIEYDDLDDEALEQYQANGMQRIALLVTPDRWDEIVANQFGPLGSYDKTVFPLHSDNQLQGYTVLFQSLR